MKTKVSVQTRVAAVRPRPASSTRKSGQRAGKEGKRQNSGAREAQAGGRAGEENKENGGGLGEQSGAGEQVGAGKEMERGGAGQVKGGFLAPTKSWLCYMGDQIDLKSRSPSPRAKPGRSPSPRRRLRASSSESEGKEGKEGKVKGRSI